MGIFTYLDDLMSALHEIEEKKLKFTLHTPVFNEELRRFLAKRPSPIRYYALIGALFGLASGFSLAVYTALQWRFIVSGKPVVPWVPFVIIGFEFLILLGVLTPFVGMLIHTRLPRLRLPDHYDLRFSDDRYGLLVQFPEDRREEVRSLFKKAGAEEIRDVG